MSSSFPKSPSPLETNQKVPNKTLLAKRIATLFTLLQLASPALVGVVNAQSVLTNQDRTVVTLDVPAPSCTSVIDDVTLTNTGATWHGSDLGAHDEDDSTESGNSAVVGGGDGFNQVLPPQTNDFSDSLFSDLTRSTMDASMKNITVDDPDEAVNYGFETDAIDTDGSGYVDLEEFDMDGNGYAAEFIDHIQCSTTSGYDLHIADTFNIDPSDSTVDYCKHDVNGFLFGDYYSFCAFAYPIYNIASREGLLRIASDSTRDLAAYASTTAQIKHEYVMDLPTDNNFNCDPSMTNDTVSGACPSAGLDPYGFYGLREWPYPIGTPPPGSNFGTVGFTLLCDIDGGQGTALAGTGRINPWTRGFANPDDVLVQGNMFREDSGTTTDCDQTPDGDIQNYAAIPSLGDLEDYDGISGNDYSTYGAILNADNWVGYSGQITGPLPTFTSSPADNYFEVRASLPDNQTAGTYAGTIILSCLPNMTSEPMLDFDGDGIGDEIDPINFQAANGSGLEDVTPVLIPLTLSLAQPMSVDVDYTITGGTATNGVDYILPMTGTVTFNPFQTLTYLPAMTVIDDNDIESSETIIITLSNPQPPAILLGTVTEFTYTILDNDNDPITCFGPYNWQRGFNMGEDCDVFSSGEHTLTFSTDIFCELDNTTITLHGTDGSVLYSDNCGTGGLNSSATYTVGPFTDGVAGTATLVLSDDYGDGGFYNLLWTYNP